MNAFTAINLAAAIQNTLAETHTDHALEILHDDTVAGQIDFLGDEPVASFNGTRGSFAITTSDGRSFTVRIDEN